MPNISKAWWHWATCPVSPKKPADRTVMPACGWTSPATLPSTHEPVLVENEQLNLLAVIEDELILSLPQVVYHDEADCAVSRDELSSGESAESDSDSPAKNPFEVLKQLKGKT
jgi:uncharacterized metal-binding protein YceD (DUF177 family)